MNSDEGKKAKTSKSNSKKESDFGRNENCNDEGCGCLEDCESENEL